MNFLKSKACVRPRWLAIAAVLVTISVTAVIYSEAFSGKETVDLASEAYWGIEFSLTIADIDSGRGLAVVYFPNRADSDFRTVYLDVDGDGSVDIYRMEIWRVVQAGKIKKGNGDEPGIITLLYSAKYLETSAGKEVLRNNKKVKVISRRLQETVDRDYQELKNRKA